MSAPLRRPAPSPLSAAAFAVLGVVLPALAVAAPPVAAADLPSPPPTPSTPPPPAPAPAGPDVAATASAAEAAAALRATQELESRMIELSGELAGLEKQRASWQDIRRRL